MTDIDRRLADLGIVLPEPVAPVANYVPYVRGGDLLILSGQLPMRDGVLLHPGKLGEGVSLEQGREAARQCLINLIAQIRHACGGDLGRVRRIARLGGFIACAPAFTAHPAVMNGASDLAVEAFGDRGRHARSTVGVPSLPLDACVEVEATVEIA